ncbi:TVP38/TMEM64 family inner membrane protein YdjZ [Sporomusa silvacetica DSM 10669]|uniref:TVP38/TMEM64 family membrane protein n=1 Tax=Sporomusa silvacetica DSM 10669 TaxID=1123289 RepID=A0ABZ3ILQ9_9FIRM|nr:TVP38/TMEM64 family protein [Sporomusa silvacetica]OZC23738.1 TVP38/TMEM64 family inner membrane protein YdjZ [Sporomusa silvacetica DSM 10669]
MISSKNTYIVLSRIGVFGLIVAAYFYLPGVQQFASEGITYLQYRNFQGLRQFILSYGIWAPVTSIALMALQSLVPLVPGIIITITNAWIFGWQYGALYSWSGALLGAVLDFWIARWYGRPVIERFVSSKFVTFTDSFLKRHGIIAVFVTRLVPIVPFKVISYGAGLTRLTCCKFTTATAIGQTPAIVLYSILGQNLSHNIKAVIAITSLLIAVGLIAYYYRNTIERYLTFPKEK